MAGLAEPAGDPAQMSKAGLLEEVVSLRTRLDESARRNAELELENRALRESEGRLATVVDHMPAVVFVRDNEGRFALVNRGYEETYGVSRDDVRGKTLGEVYPKEVAEGYAAHDRRVQTERKVIEEELAVGRDGAQRVFSSVKFPILDPAGELIAIGGIEQDITSQKRAEQAHRQSEARLGLALHATGAGVWDYDLVTGDSWWSDELYRLLGYEPGELAPTYETWLSLLHPEDRDRIANGEADDLNAWKAGQSTRSEYRIRRKDGSPIWIEDMATATLGDDEQVVRQTGIMRDITARKRAEEALRESEQRLLGILASSPTGAAIGIADEDNPRIVYVNERYAEMYGATESDLLGSDPRERYADQAERQKAVRGSERDGKAYDVEMRLRRLDGSEFWGLCSFFPIEYGGQAARIVWVHDITEIKRGEEALREREGVLTSILESAPVGSSIVRRDGTLAYVNDCVCEIFGMSREALLGSKSTDLYYVPSDREGVLQRLSKDGAVRDLEVPFRKADGSPIWGLLSLLRGEYQGEPALYGWIYDITDRKAAEEEIEEARDAIEAAQARLTDAIENMSDAIVVYDVDGRLEFCNSRFKQFYGYSEEEATPGASFDDLGRLDTERGVVSGGAEGAKAYFDRRAAIRAESAGSFQVELSDGRWLQIRDRTTSSGGIVSVQADITESKRAEKVLKESQQRLIAMLAESPVGVAIAYEGDATLAYANPRMDEMFGYPIGALIGRHASTLYVDTESRKPVMERYLRDGKVEDVEMHTKRSDGSDFWCLVSFYRFEFEGRPARLGWFYDITDRKKAEEMAEKRADQLRAVLDNIPAGVYLANADLEIEVYNDQFGELYGFPDGLVYDGQKLPTLVLWLAEHGNYADMDVEEAVAARVAMLRSGKQASAEQTPPTGRPVQLTYGPTGHGGVCGVITDITEHKKAEAALEESRAQLDTILESSPAGISVTLADSGALAYANAHFAELLRLGEDRNLGQVLRDFWTDPEDRARIIDRIKQDGEVRDVEVERRRADGSSFWALMSGQVITYKGQDAILAWTADITERKKAEQRFRALLESAPDAMVIVDRDGKIVLVNQQTERLFGYGTDELMGREVEILVPERLRARHPEHRRNFFDKAGVRPMGAGLELHGVAKGGREFPIEISLSPIETAEGMLVSAAVRDITERKRVEHELQRKSKLIELLSQTAEAANKAASFETALAECLTLICKNIDWPVGHAYVRPPDGAERMVCSGIWYLSDEERFKAFKEISEKTSFEPGVGLPGSVMAGGRPEWIDDVTQQLNFVRGKGGGALGLHSAFAAPVIEGTDVLAVLEFFTEEVLEPDELTLQTFQALMQVGDQLGQVMRRVRAAAELRQSKESAEAALADLQTAQQQLVRSEKMASLGQLTAGIAHEIKNPLNFVNNFSETSVELLGELEEALEPVQEKFDQDTRDEVDDIVETLKGDLEKVNHHGKRADGIVRSMLLHARGDEAQRLPTGVNDLVDEALNLAFHGERARDTSFQVTLERNFGEATGEAAVLPQEITRVLVNIFSNAFYAVKKRHKAAEKGYEPTVTVWTDDKGEEIEIRVRDNGTGMPEEVREKLFDPFFTTKPTGEGTGLGMSMSFDIIVQQHGGRIEVASEAGVFTEFVIGLPRQAPAA